MRVGAGGVVGDGGAGADGLVVGVGVDEQDPACAHAVKVSEGDRRLGSLAALLTHGSVHLRLCS
ncbi:hypothetical protein GCM10010403_43100 [Glycomyces rutgersensis]|uniref:Uncharacterized protein n=1 Tax=Glycomyces rutgersensis TaxID=58115 RepID=A0ABP5T486_9ACTN